MSTDAQYVKAPRNIGIDFFLGAVTFSLFTCVWLYQAIRDINRIRSQGFQPWLWVFVPLILLAQFFALPRLTKALRETEQELHLTSWSKNLDNAWVISVILLSIVVSAQKWLPFTSAQDLMLFLLWMGVFLSIGPRINRMREASSLPKTQLTAKLSNYEWATALLLTPISFLVVWMGGLQTYFVSVEAIASGQRVENIQYGFAITTAGDSWHQVEIGTHSNGEAEMEFTGHDSQASVVIFEQKKREIISELTQWRITEAHENMSDVSCTEHRTIMPGTAFIRIHVYCEGTLMNDPSMQIHELVQIGEEHYIEAYAKYSATEIEYNRESPDFIETVKSLEVLDKSE